MIRDWKKQNWKIGSKETWERGIRCISPSKHLVWPMWTSQVNFQWSRILIIRWTRQTILFITFPNHIIHDRWANGQRDHGNMDGSSPQTLQHGLSLFKTDLASATADRPSSWQQRSVVFPDTTPFPGISAVTNWHYLHHSHHGREDFVLTSGINFSYFRYRFAFPVKNIYFNCHF